MPLVGDTVILLSFPKPPILSQQPNINSLSQGGRSFPPNPLTDNVLSTVLAQILRLYPGSVLGNTTVMDWRCLSLAEDCKTGPYIVAFTISCQGYL